MMKGWNGEMLLPLTLFHTSTSIHQAIHLSHSSLLLFHTSVSLSPVGSCLEVPSVSAIQGGDRADEAQGRDIKRGMLALVLPHPISIWVAGPSICLRMIWSWLPQERKKGPPPMTNDNLRINTQVREGRRKRAESLFHHPSASVGLLINLWSLPLTLFWCLSFIFFLFTHSPTSVKIWGNFSFCNKIKKKCYGILSLFYCTRPLKSQFTFYFKHELITSLNAWSHICEAEVKMWLMALLSCKLNYNMHAC